MSATPSTVKIERLHGRNAEEFPFYRLHVQNAKAVTGRSVNLVIPLSFEDVLALREAANQVVTRKADSAEIKARAPGELFEEFYEIPE